MNDEKPTNDDPNVIAYRVGQLEKSQNIGFAKIERKLDDLTTGFATVKALSDVKEELHTANTALVGRIKKLESWNEWAVKLVLGTIILAVLGLVITKNT